MEIKTPRQSAASAAAAAARPVLRLPEVETSDSLLGVAAGEVEQNLHEAAALNPSSCARAGDEGGERSEDVMGEDGCEGEDSASLKSVYSVLGQASFRSTSSNDTDGLKDVGGDQEVDANGEWETLESFGEYRRLYDLELSKPEAGTESVSSQSTAVEFNTPLHSDLDSMLSTGRPHRPHPPPTYEKVVRQRLLGVPSQKSAISFDIPQHGDSMRAVPGVASSDGRGDLVIFSCFAQSSPVTLRPRSIPTIVLLMSHYTKLVSRNYRVWKLFM